MLLEIVLKDTDLGRCEEVRLCWVEGKALNDSFSLREWFLRGCLAQRVDDNLGRCLDLVSHRCEVVALRVPGKSADDMLKLQSNHDLVLFQVFREHPLDISLFNLFADGCKVTVIELLSLLE